MIINNLPYSEDAKFITRLFFRDKFDNQRIISKFALRIIKKHKITEYDRNTCKRG